MAQFRLRHPKGVTTIQIDLGSATVQDLLQEINKITEIPPSQQDGMSVMCNSPGLALTHFLSKGRIPPQELDTDTRVTYLESWTVQGRTVDSQSERTGTRYNRHPIRQ